MKFINESEELEPKRQDFDDLQNEYADRETGRMKRFLTRQERETLQRQRERDRSSVRTLLEMLFDDPVYRARYEEVRSLLGNAMAAAERALADLIEQITEAEAFVEGVEGRAARLPDGDRVYRDARGVIRRQDGSAVGDTLAATILWTGNEPSYEEMGAARDRLDSLTEERLAIDDYQNNVLGPVLDRLEDPDEPPSLDELDRILEEIETEMPEIVRHQQVAPEPRSAGIVGLDKIDVPSMGQTS